MCAVLNNFLRSLFMVYSIFRLLHRVIMTMAGDTGGCINSVLLYLSQNRDRFRSKELDCGRFYQYRMIEHDCRLIESDTIFQIATHFQDRINNSTFVHITSFEKDRNVISRIAINQIL